MKVRTKSQTFLFEEGDLPQWCVEVEGVRHILTDQDILGHSHLRWRKDENKWITVEILPDGKAQFLHFGPNFEHDCKNCEYWGEFFGLDVWYCATSDGGVLGGSIIARHGDDGADYGSSPLSILLRHYDDPDCIIGDHTVTPHENLPFREWLFKRGADFEKAWVVALAAQAVKMLCEKNTPKQPNGPAVKTAIEEFQATLTDEEKADIDHYLNGED